MQNSVQAAIAFACNNCKWQLLYALLQLTTFDCTIASNNYCQHIAVCMHISSSPLCSYHWNWHSCYALLHMTFLHYVNQNIQLILHLTTFVCTFYVWLQMIFHLCSIAKFTSSIINHNFWFTITIDMLYCNR